MKKIIVLFVFGTGAFYLFSGGYMVVKAELSHYFIEQAWHETLENKQNNKPWSWADTYPILKISIPRIAKESYVLQGESGRNMAFSVVHHTSSGMPGHSKSTLISGHNDTHFSYLEELKIGDNIITQDKNNSHVYKVSEIKIINSSKEKLNIRNTNELILTTCYPFSDLQIDNNLRFVVYASPDISPKNLLSNI